MNVTKSEFEMNNNHYKNNFTEPENHKNFESESTNQPLPIPQCYLQNRNIPAIYMQIWNKVRNMPVCNENEFCNQDKLYQTLLLTNLESDVLAKVWAFVNRTIPGQLTRNELFVMMGIIAFLQQNKEDPIKELYRISNIPSPVFNLDVSPIISQKDFQNKLEDFADFKSAKFDDCDKSSRTSRTSPLSLNDNLKSQRDDDESKKIIDKYSYFRDIEHQVDDNKIMKGSFDEFGDFLSHDDTILESLKNLTVADKDTVSWMNSNEYSIKNRFLISYDKILKQIFRILVVENAIETVMEALNTNDGKNFILDLLEIQHISDRISVTTSENETLSRSMLDDINENWNCISKILDKSQIMLLREHSFSEHDNFHSATGECRICTGLTYGENDSFLFADIRYHTTCANFWQNCVENSLPK